MTRAGVLLSFFLIGVSAVVDWAAWTWLLALSVGSWERAAAVVAASFLGGLGLGGFLGRRLADRSRAPLAVFGWAALIFGGYSLLVPGLLALADPLLGAIYRFEDWPSHPFFAATSALLGALAILPAAVLLGAMLPLLARLLAILAGEVGGWLGSLQALGALGGFAGLWSAVFLIPRLGLRSTPVLAAGACGWIGAVAILKSYRRQASQRAPLAPLPPAALPVAVAVHTPPPARVKLVLASCGAWGMASAALVWAWIRAVNLSLGTHTYALAITASIVLLGLSVGSTLAATFADRLKSPQAALGWCIAGAAACALVTTPALGTLPPEFAHRLSGLKLPPTFFLFLFLGAARASFLIFPAAVLLGAVFPLAGRALWGSQDRIGRAVGVLSFASGLGAVLGTLLSAFVLLPLAGRLWAALYLGAAMGLVAGLLLVLRNPAVPSRQPLRVAAAAALLTLLAVPAFSTRPWGVLDREGQQRYWSPLTLSIGPLLHYRLAEKFSQVGDLELAYHAIYEVLYYRDGETASVGAFRARGTDLQSLRIGGEIEASSGAGSMEMPIQLLSGHLPLLHRSGARSALTVGLGGGVTLGVMTLYPTLQRLACVEASPEVVEAAARFFGGPNHRALENPKVSLIVGDARNHLRHNRSRYDIITCQPTGFWVAGVGTLFTSEFHALVKGRLAPGGVVCQRLAASRIGVEDFRMALRAFLETFPRASLWTAGGHALLLGSLEPVEWSRGWIESCLAEPAIREDLIALGIDRPEALFRYLRMEGDALWKLAGRGPVSRELFPRLEHFAPGGLFKRENVLPLLLAAPAEPLAVPGFGSEAEIEGYRRRGVMLHLLEDRLSRLMLDEAVERLIEIVAEGDRWVSARAAQLIARYSLQGLDEEWRLLLRRALLVLDDPVLIKASRSLGPGTLDPTRLKGRERRALKRDWTLQVLQAQEALDRRDPQAALEAAAAAQARGAPGYRLGLLEGFAHALLGDLDTAERSYRQALDGAPERERAEVLYNLGFAREKRGDFEGAAEYQRKSLALGADPMRGGLALSRSLRAAGRTAEALAAAEEVSKRMESPEALHEAALALLELGNPQAALEKLVQAAAAAPERYLKELETLEARLKSKEGN